MRHREFVLEAQLSGSPLRNHSLNQKSFKTTTQGSERFFASKKILRSLRNRGEPSLGGRRISRDEFYRQRAILRFDQPVPRVPSPHRIIERRTLILIQEIAS